MFYTNAPIPEHRPGEPALPDHAPLSLLAEAAKRLVKLLLTLVLIVPLWPIYLLSRLIWPRPAVLPDSARYLRFLRAALRPIPAPGLPGVLRLFLLDSLVQQWLRTPLSGLAWQLDELLYGRKLRAVPLTAPLFELSAARSGSTQLAHYLEDDPDIYSPGVLQTMLPYLWLWKLARRFGPMFTTPEQVQAWLIRSAPPAFVQRHELDAFRTDSFEVIYSALQLGEIAARLGPTLYLANCQTGVLTPENRTWWEEDFVSFTEALLRKTALFAPRPGQVMIKGHFLAAAPALARRFPEARFMTVIRDPLPRLQSGINFLRVQPLEPVFGPVAWPWLVEVGVTSELGYNAAEMRWYQQNDGVSRTVVRFDDYVRDLPGTMEKVYREFVGRPTVPPHVPRVHAARHRAQYAVDRSLADLGVKVEALNAEFKAYRAWIRGET